MFHRVWQCPHSAAAREGCKPALIRAALAHPHDPFFSRGWIQTPIIAQPLETIELRYELFSGGSDVADVSRFSFAAQDGPIFPDGSCLYPRSPLLARAGFGLVQAREDGSVFKAVFGNLPRHFPQTAVASEHVALVFLRELVDVPRDLVVFDDCMTCVSSHQRGPIFACRSNNMMGGFWRDMFSHSGGGR